MRSPHGAHAAAVVDAFRVTQDVFPGPPGGSIARNAERPGETLVQVAGSKGALKIRGRAQTLKPAQKRPAPGRRPSLTRRDSSFVWDQK